LTGTTADRPQLRKLITKLASGDVVIIPAVDQMSRDTTDLFLITREMQKAGAGIRSLAERSFGFCRDRLCDPWRRRKAGTPPHPRPHRPRPGRRQNSAASLPSPPYLQREAVTRRDVDGETLRSTVRSYNVSPQTISRLRPQGLA
jgi:hypothetical protein